jgi:hypothetical protein
MELTDWQQGLQANSCTGEYLFVSGKYYFLQLSEYNVHLIGNDGIVAAFVGSLIGFL